MQLRTRLFFLGLLFTLQFSYSSEADLLIVQDTLHGKVVGIADGDTFTMLLDKDTTVKVRP